MQQSMQDIVRIDLEYGQYGHRQGAHTQPSPDEEKFNTKVPLGNSQDRTRLRTLDHRMFWLSCVGLRGRPSPGLASPAEPLEKTPLGSLAHVTVPGTLATA